MKRQKHLPKWNIYLIYSVVIVFIVIVVWRISNPRIELDPPRYFIYSIDTYSEDEIPLLSKTNSENIYMVDGERVREWEYKLERPRYISMISKKNQEQHEFANYERQMFLDRRESEKNYKGSYQEYCDMQKASWSEFQYALKIKDYERMVKVSREMDLRKYSPHWVRWVSDHD